MCSTQYSISSVVFWKYLQSNRKWCLTARLSLKIWVKTMLFLVVFCCCSVAKSCLTLRNSMNCSTPGFPVLHYLPEFSQTCLHWVGNAIQPCHPLSPSSPACNLSQQQGLFHWVHSLHHVAKKSNTSLKIDENRIVPLVHILSFYCSPHNRPVIERQVAGAGKILYSKSQQTENMVNCTPKTILSELELSPFLY